MGNPMAENLIKSGKKVRVFDVSKEMMEQAKKQGLSTSDSIDSLGPFNDKRDYFATSVLSQSMFNNRQARTITNYVTSSS